MANTSVISQSAKVVRASARHLRIAPRKVRLVTNLVNGMKVDQAIVQLQHTEKKASGIVIKLLKSAVANAANNFSLSPERLYIKSITADGGRVLKRHMARARGSASTIHRRMSHINVILQERGGKAKTSKFNLFKKKEEQAAPENIDKTFATNEKPTSELPKKRDLFRADEQRKMNIVQNKRRLFNRKSGE